MITKLLNKLEQRTEKQIVILLFLAAFILKTLYVLIFYFTQPLPETNLYYELALEIIAQGKFLYQTSHPYYEFPGPVLPWINAFTMMVFGKNYLGLYLVTAFGSSLITIYTYKTARLFLDRAASFFIGTWSALYLFYFYYTPNPGKDIWMAFFMIFLIYNFILLFTRNQFSYQRFILFSIMFAVSFHLDERFFVFTPFIGLYILYSETHGFRKFSITRTTIFGLLLIILMLPWTIRNYEKYNKIVILTTRTEALTDPFFGYESKGHLIDEYTDVYGAYYIHEYQIDSVISGKKTHTDQGIMIKPEMVKAMKDGLKPRPLTGIRAFASRIRTMFEPVQLRGRFERTGYFYYKKSFRHNIATFLFYGLLLLFSLPGFYYLYKKDKSIFYIFLFVIIIYGMIHALTIPYTNWRYRLPLDSLFIISGCFGMLKSFDFVNLLTSKRTNK